MAQNISGHLQILEYSNNLNTQRSQLLVSVKIKGFTVLFKNSAQFLQKKKVLVCGNTFAERANILLDRFVHGVPGRLVLGTVFFY